MEKSDLRRFFKADKHFQHLRENDIDKILDNSRLLLYRKDETIVKQGQLLNDVPIIVSGLVKIYNEGFQKNRLVGLNKHGEIPGISYVFYDGEIDVTVRATRDCEVLFVDKNIFIQIVRNNANLATNLFEHFSFITRYLIYVLSSQTQKQIRGKLAEALIYLDNIEENNKYIARLSRQDMAELAGMSLSNVSRLIGDFKKDGIIQLHGKEIEILDYKKLKEIQEKE